MYFDFTSDNITSLLSYSGGFLDDIWPIILIILGISIGGFILRLVLHIGK